MLMVLPLSGCATIASWFGHKTHDDQAQPVVVQRFACESKGKDLHYCDVETAAGIRLVKQVSNIPCIKERTWGYNRHGVWVDKGCRGEFMAGAGDDDDPLLDTAHGVVRCESDEQRRRRCNTAVTRTPVELLKQLSDTQCVQGQSWGWDGQGIWVDGGCRALFRVR